MLGYVHTRQPTVILRRDLMRICCFGFNLIFTSVINFAGMVILPCSTRKSQNLACREELSLVQHCSLHMAIQGRSSAGPREQDSTKAPLRLAVESVSGDTETGADQPGKQENYCGFLFVQRQYQESRRLLARTRFAVPKNQRTVESLQVLGLQRCRRP